MDSLAVASMGLDLDIQSQADLLYANILASVDQSLDSSVSKDSLSAGILSKKHRRLHHSRYDGTFFSTNVCGMVSNKTDNNSVASAGVTTVETDDEKRLHSCCDDVLDVSSFVLSNVEAGDSGLFCPCRCHGQCPAHDLLLKGQRSKEIIGTPCKCCAGLSDVPNAQHKMVTKVFDSGKSRLDIKSSSPSESKPPSTFGSGRKGMSDPIKKTSAPGPGSYFWGDDYRPRRMVSSSYSGYCVTKTSGRLSAENEGKALKCQFESLCLCYWKEFKELETPTNPSAHAKNCPCQLIRVSSPESESHKSSSNESHAADSKIQQRIYAAPVTSPRRREMRQTKRKTAVLDTSPCPATLGEKHHEISVSKENKYHQHARARSSEKGDSDVRSGRCSVSQKKTPLCNQNDVSSMPGPGAYNVASAFDAVSVKGKAKGVSFGKARRNLHTLTDSPGPGTYDTEAKGMVDKQERKNYFFTTSPRQLQLVTIKEGEDRPGPGEYSTEEATRLEARCKTAPAFTFGRAKLPSCARTLFSPWAADKADEVPGPGTYDVSNTLLGGDVPHSGRGIVITTAGRSDNMWRGVHFEQDDVPGPGTYTLTDNQRGPAYFLGLRPTERVEVTPGPGHYVLPSESTGPRWTLSARLSSPIEQEPSPGPGDYFVPIFDLRRTHSKAPFFALAPRLLHEKATQAAMLPGPGAYDMNDMTGATRSVVMGSAQRLFSIGASVDDVPGPGAYTVQHALQERRVGVPLLASTSSRFDSGKSGVFIHPTPGPGSYDINALGTVAKKRGAIIGNSPRTLTFDGCVTDIDVGPGAYDVTLTKDGPFFSFGRLLPDPATLGEPLPGPGLYNLQNLPSGPSAVVGVAARFQLSDEEKTRRDVPGPGAYEAVALASKIPLVVFGTSPRLLHEKEVENNNKSGLGPGSYDPQEARGNIAGAARTAGPRFVGDSHSEVPGPGAYDVVLHSPNRAVPFGTAGEKSDWLVPAATAELPGPGSYLPQHPQERSAPAAVFGTSPQHVLLPEEREILMKGGIGPGSYEVALPASHSFHATFGTAQTERDKLPELTPGPGQYTQVDTEAPLPRTIKFGTASRIPWVSKTDATPGPGAYTPTSMDINGLSVGPVSFPNAPRFSNADKTAGYGDISGTPGPGSYMLDLEGRHMTSGGAALFGTEPRFFEYDQRDRALLPGPSQYQPLIDGTKSSVTAYSFGKEPRILEKGGDKNGEMPGPGAYDIIVPTFTVPTTHFGTGGRMIESSSLAEVPGPGTYDVTTANIKSGHTHSFPTAPREFHVHASDTPGPGQYDRSSADNNQWCNAGAPSFPMGPRFSEVKDADTLYPGPGQYFPCHPKWDAGMAHTFPTSGRELLSSNVDVPGPGTYNPTLPANGPAIRIGNSERSNIHQGHDESIPGPGTYDVNLRTQDTPVFSMYRTAPRGPTLVDVEKSNFPGPGAYTIPPSFPITNGPGASVSFVKAVRFQDVGGIVGDRADVPGPGFYDPQPPQLTAGPIIGRAPRLAEVGGGTSASGADLPGPGHYDVGRGDPIVTTSVDGGVTIRFTATRFPTDGNSETSKTPGPGSYNPLEPRCLTSGTSFPQAPRFNLAEDAEAADCPGPGEYSIPSAWPPSEVAGYSFGTSTRMDLFNAMQEMPGPGSYDASRYASMYLAGPAFTMQGKTKFVEGSSTADYPGPGEYFLRPMEVTRTTKFDPLPTVMPDALFEARVNATPGPAAYNIPTTLEQKAATIGTAARTVQQGEDFPGPGAYLTGGPIIVPSQPTFSFGTAPRPNMVSLTQHDVPGPGEYHHPTIPRPSVPTFSFSSTERFGETNGSSMPGPGEYYHPVIAESSNGPTFSFPTASRSAATTAGVSNMATRSGVAPGAHYRPYM